MVKLLPDMDRDTDRDWGLDKSARVLVDECVIAGLDCKIEATQKSEVTMEENTMEENKTEYGETVSLQVEGNESVVAWEALLRGTTATSWGSRPRCRC